MPVAENRLKDQALRGARSPAAWPLLGDTGGMLGEMDELTRLETDKDRGGGSIP